MDTVSHALYGYAAMRWRGPRSARWGALLGAAPDLLYAIPSTIRRVVRDGWNGLSLGGGSDRSVWLKDGPPLPPDLVADYNDFYRYTHSLVLLGAVALLWYAVRRKPPWLLLPYTLHIVMDIPSHERYTTQFLFPLTDWSMVGYAWSRPPLLIANIITLALIYGWLWSRFWRPNHPARPPWPEQIEGVA